VCQGEETYPLPTSASGTLRGPKIQKEDFGGGEDLDLNLSLPHFWFEKMGELEGVLFRELL
jgi:hypothetical protein